MRPIHIIFGALCLIGAPQVPAHPGVESPTCEDTLMPYATRADLVSRFEADEIDDIAALAGNTSRADTALTDAAADIDAALAEHYVLPLTGEWPMLRAIACDIARAKLYDNAAPKRILGAASSARKRLRAIGERRLRLVSATGALAPMRESILIDAGEPIASRTRLAGYLGPAPTSEWC